MDIGSYVKPLMNIVAAAATVEVDGAAVQLVGQNYDYSSGVLLVGVGTPTGTPTSFSIAANIQDSADGSTGWADVTGTSITAITANGGQASVKIILRGTRGYIRAKVVPAFVGGSSPAIPIAAAFTLGGTLENLAV
jgi:hypothetical protein